MPGAAEWNLVAGERQAGIRVDDRSATRALARAVRIAEVGLRKVSLPLERRRIVGA